MDQHSDDKENRSEGLLPGDDDDSEDDAGNDRYEVAEEMNLDQQSDATRHIGNLPAGEEGEAEAREIGETLKGDK